jgi:hypothetical protein
MNHKLIALFLYFSLGISSLKGQTCSDAYQQLTNYATGAQFTYNNEVAKIQMYVHPYWQPKAFFDLNNWAAYQRGYIQNQFAIIARYCTPQNNRPEPPPVNETSGIPELPDQEVVIADEDKDDHVQLPNPIKKKVNRFSLNQSYLQGR